MTVPLRRCPAVNRAGARCRYALGHVEKHAPGAPEPAVVDVDDGLDDDSDAVDAFWRARDEALAREEPLS